MAGELPTYKAWLERRPCQSCEEWPPSVVHHSTANQPGMGKRAHDRYGISLCGPCHTGFHGASGRFKTTPRAERRAWQNRCVLANWSAYAAEGLDLGVVMGTIAPAEDDDDVF